MPNPFSNMGPNPFGANPTGMGSVPDPTGLEPNADIGTMMQDPNFQRALQESMKKKQKDKYDMLLEGGGTVQDLVQAFPELQKAQEMKKQMEYKKKLKDSEMKTKSIKFDALFKRSQEAVKQLEKQQQQQQKQQ